MSNIQSKLIDLGGNITGILPIANGGTGSATLNQFNIEVGNGSNIRTATNTNLIGDISASTVSQSYTVTSASPGVFTVAAAPATGTKAYVTVTQNGFTANTTYYVTNVSGTTFKLATTLANAVAGTNITSSGTTAGVVNSGGMVLTSGVRGVITGSAPTAGYVGEQIIQTRVSSNLNLTTGTFTEGTTSPAALTPGIWIVSATARFDRDAGITQTDAFVFVGTASGNNTTGLVVGQAAAEVPSSIVGVNGWVLNTAPYYLNISTAANYYCKVFAKFTGSGNCYVTDATIQGIRIA